MILRLVNYIVHNIEKTTFFIRYKKYFFASRVIDDWSSLPEKGVNNSSLAKKKKKKKLHVKFNFKLE